MWVVCILKEGLEVQKTNYEKVCCDMLDRHAPWWLTTVLPCVNILWSVNK